MSLINQIFCVLGLCILPILAGCVSETFTPSPNDQPSLVLPVPKLRPDPLAAQDHRRLLSAFGGEYQFANAQILINEIVNRLAPSTQRPDLNYRVTILNSANINAFALPNGSIYVTRGLLSLANSTSELSSVLAHEMAHVTAQHAIERAELERRSTLVSRVNADLLNDPQTGQARQNEGRVAIASFSRKQELEADQIGVRVMAKAGYDPYGAIRFLKSLEKSSILRGKNASNTGVDFMSTHPLPPERIDVALAAARQLSVTGNIPQDQLEKDHNRYVQAIHGMFYGDDPVDGLINGIQFIHPRLGFVFNAPDGFILKNSSQAVLGQKEMGQQGLRFETVRIPAAMSLADYLKKSPVEGAETSRFETLSIPGFEAATALANTQDWTYRFAVFRSSGRAYRMILAAQNFNSETDSQFMKSLLSFHKLSPDENQNIQISKIISVLALASDTVSGLAERMAGPQKLERFLILNGLDPQDTLKPGTRYKIIG